ncbi:MAG: hypothetical protein K9J13_05530 [Saprospiraceae bacterium]|nr:hypothetical protein [Saprospiraceae bacterium]
MNEKQNIYLIPGIGGDERSFKNLKFDTTFFDIIHIKYEIPNKGEDLQTYALRLAEQIDTTKGFFLIGVSLGGMIATEINDKLNPTKTIIISSAKCRTELPARYRFQSTLPIYKIVPKGCIKRASFVAQAIVEPDRKKEKETCIAMLKDKNPFFLKRTIEMIANWERTDYDQNIIHIHGNNDHTIPIKNVKYNFLIEDGSHMIILTRSNEIGKLINSILKNLN